MNKLSGILLVNKPSGPTSHDVVAQARKILGTREVGHTGTLDPIASGLLILTVGKANKLSQYLMDGQKGYRVIARLGVETDTLDREGKILSQKDVNVTSDKIKLIISEMVGDLQLKVPAFSAVKIDGKKLYEMARKDQDVPVIERTMTFYEAKFVEQNAFDVDIYLKCSKGAYVRSWVQEFGGRLGCGASVQELERVYNAPYELSQAQSPDELGLDCEAWIPFDNILPDWPRVEAFENELVYIGNGQVSARIMAQAQRSLYERESCPQGVFITSPINKEILCFLEVSKEGQTLRLKKVFAPSRA